MGETWTDAKQSPRFAADPKPEPGDQTPWFMLQNQVMERCWHIQPGRASEPNVMYCGVGPAALFRSEDNGDTWEENASLSAHPSKQYWNPGAGGLILHSVVLDPKNKDRMWIAISAAGVVRTDDGGAEHRFGSLVIVSLCALALAAVFALATHGSGTATVLHSPDAVATSNVADAGLDEQHFMFFLHGADALAFPSAEAAAR
jgi:hypothetical protein